MIDALSKNPRMQIRAAAVVFERGALLVHRLEGDAVWTLPGGRVHAGESAEEAVVREIREELGVEACCASLLSVGENFFDLGGELYHEIGLYFSVQLRQPGVVADPGRTHYGIEGARRLEFRWVAADALPGLDFRPAALRGPLAAGDLPPHFVQRDPVAAPEPRVFVRDALGSDGAGIHALLLEQGWAHRIESPACLDRLLSDGTGAIMSQAISDLDTLLRSMEPTLHDGVYAYCVVPYDVDLHALAPVVSVQEAEGLTLVLPQRQAIDAGLKILFRAAWITLKVHSDLQAVGLTAAFAGALGEAGISCNVVAGAFHDHLFVPMHEGERALDVLRALQQAAAHRSPA